MKLFGFTDVKKKETENYKYKEFKTRGGGGTPYETDGDSRRLA